jgi:hemerythrin-like domain-containing protein
MMVSVTLLQYDHGLIRQVIDVLGVVVKKKNANEHIEDVKDMAMFLDRFIDQMHHAKEERFLFPKAVELQAMQQKDMDELVADHTAVRKLAKEILEELRREDMEAFYRDAYTMVLTMHAHIRREEETVFPYMDEHLGEEGDSFVYKRYEDYIMRNFPPDFYGGIEDMASRVQDHILGKGYFQGLKEPWK